MATKGAAIVDKDSQKSNTNQMCRLCLKPATTESLVDIFDSSTETSLTIRIMACAGLEVIQCKQTRASKSEIFCLCLIEADVIFAGVRARCSAEKNVLRLSVAIGEIFFVSEQK